MKDPNEGQASLNAWILFSSGIAKGESFKFTALS